MPSLDVRTERRQLDPLIVLKDVSKSYGAVPVLRRCSISRSAAARSSSSAALPARASRTLIKCINGLEPYSPAASRSEGIEVGAKATNLPRLRAAHRHGVPAFRALPAYVGRSRTSCWRKCMRCSRTRKEAQARACRLLDRVGLASTGATRARRSLRRPAAAHRHRTRAGARSSSHAVRRTDVRARSGNDHRGAWTSSSRSPARA